MKIKTGVKYKVITECHSFKNLDDPIEKEGFVLFPGEEYTVDFLFDRGGIGFVYLGTFKNEFGEEVERSIGLAIFENCFEEISRQV